MNVALLVRNLRNRVATGRVLPTERIVRGHKKVSRRVLGIAPRAVRRGEGEDQGRQNQYESEDDGADPVPPPSNLTPQCR